MKHAEKATPESEAQRIGCLGLVEQRGIIKGEFAQRISEILVVVGVHRKDPRVDLRLDALKARQSRRFLMRSGDQGVSNRSPFDVFDARHDKTHLSCHQAAGFCPSWREDADHVGLMLFAGRAHHKLVALAQLPLLDSHQRHDTQIIVEPGINNECLQRRFAVAFWCRHIFYEVLEHIFDTETRLGACRHCARRVDTDDLFNFLLHALRIGLGQVHLIEHRQHLEALLDRCVAVSHRLRFNTLTRIHHQQCPFAGSQRARHLIGEIHMTGRVDKIQLILLTVSRLVIQGDALGFNRDAPLPLQIHGVEHLFGHLTLS